MMKQLSLACLFICFATITFGHPTPLDEIKVAEYDPSTNAYIPNPFLFDQDSIQANKHILRLPAKFDYTAATAATNGKTKKPMSKFTKPSVSPIVPEKEPFWAKYIPKEEPVKPVNPYPGKYIGEIVDKVPVSPAPKNIVEPSDEDFWESYGEKIQEAFIKSKYETINDDEPTPEGFWTNFAKNIAFTFDSALSRAAQIADEAKMETAPVYQKISKKKPVLKMAAPPATTDTTATPAFFAPAIYWKMFGQKITETFNKTKNATAPEDDTSMDATASATLPSSGVIFVPPGMMIGKAFVDAKTKITKQTKKSKKPTTPSPIDADMTMTETLQPVLDLDDTFWDDFTKTLENAIIQKNAATTTTTETPALDQVADETSMTYNLRFAMPKKVKIDPTTPAPQAASEIDEFVNQIYKLQAPKKAKEVKDTTTTDDDPKSSKLDDPEYVKAKTDFLNTISKMKTIVPLTPLAPPTLTPTTPTGTLPTAASFVPTAIPGLYWKTYGQNIGGQFISSKMNIVNAAKTMKTTTSSPMEEESEDDMEARSLKMAAADPILPSSILYWKAQMMPKFVPIQSALDPTYQAVIEDPTSEDSTQPIFVPADPLYPGLYWKTYGQNIGTQFINAKGQIIDAVSTTKPKVFPYLFSPVGPVMYDDFSEDPKAKLENEQTGGGKQTRILKLTNTTTTTSRLATFLKFAKHHYKNNSNSNQIDSNSLIIKSKFINYNKSLDDNKQYDNTINSKINNKTISNNSVIITDNNLIDRRKLFNKTTTMNVTNCCFNQSNNTLLNKIDDNRFIGSRIKTQDLTTNNSSINNFDKKITKNSTIICSKNKKDYNNNCNFYPSTPTYLDFLKRKLIDTYYLAKNSSTKIIVNVQSQIV